MTITYNLDVATSKLSNFSRILLRWHGSVWKSIYKEMIAWMIVYMLLNLLYRFAMTDDQRRVFEDVVAYCFLHGDFIPITFILGFFVTLVVQRWWEMFNCFGWIDNVALYVATYVIGKDDETRMIRRNIVRYVALVQAMVFRDVSPVVRDRFPNDEAFEAAGFLTEGERKAMESVITSHAKYWLPIHWAFTLIKQARMSGRIAHDRAVELIFERIREFRTGLTKLRATQWVPVPLAYTQVVFLAGRCYLLLGIVGRQHVDSERHAIIHIPLDTYIPILSVLQFVFYLGLMKVAETLLNPYGYDDDDFECNWFIDRNFQVSLAIVDEAVGKEPDLEQDVFFQAALPESIYSDGRTTASRKRPKTSSVLHANFGRPRGTKSVNLSTEAANRVSADLEAGAASLVDKIRYSSHQNLSTTVNDETDPGNTKRKEFIVTDVNEAIPPPPRKLEKADSVE